MSLSLSCMTPLTPRPSLLLPSLATASMPCSFSLPRMMPASKNSRSVHLVVGSTRSTAKLKQERYNDNIAGLSTESQTLLADMQHEAVDSTNTGIIDTMDAMNSVRFRHSSSSAKGLALLLSHILDARIAG
ncbi:uncharacterized protein F5147DRAFT_657328 [Suillus discolor]|uniref:Uncharacterized protein n=1 Tax=Suillus discolor TaxID=1912936 RepID=A0A9P7JNT1_9AGAM|nr:uncharacterized protein F5147DRAFT_657328 [Suillus discolor]KAG2093704.1 hypothetical protein F5147DRAFT_657328 [Suillus discolor]